jgi:hypothetical protein
MCGNELKQILMHYKDESDYFSVLLTAFYELILSFSQLRAYYRKSIFPYFQTSPTANGLLIMDAINSIISNYNKEKPIPNKLRDCIKLLLRDDELSENDSVYPMLLKMLERIFQDTLNYFIRLPLSVDNIPNLRFPKKTFCISFQIEDALKKSFQSNNDLSGFVAGIEQADSCIDLLSNCKLRNQFVRYIMEELFVNIIQERLLNKDTTIQQTALQYAILVIEKVTSPQLQNEIYEFFFSEVNTIEKPSYHFKYHTMMCKPTIPLEELELKATHYKSRQLQKVILIQLQNSQTCPIALELYDAFLTKFNQYILNGLILKYILSFNSKEEDNRNSLNCVDISFNKDLYGTKWNRAGYMICSYNKVTSSICKLNKSTAQTTNTIDIEYKYRQV